MTVSFLFFHFFFLFFILLSHPCGPAHHAPPSRPPPSPTPPHNPPPPPSPTARARALPSPADLAALWIPPLPALARRRYAERCQSGGGPHGSMCGDDCIVDRAPGETNRVPVERIKLRGRRIGFRSAVAPWAWRRRRARPPVGDLPAGGSSSPGGGGGHPPGGGGARLQGGLEGELGAATMCGVDRPTPTKVREEGQ
jgi:hypothetical protein